MNETSVVGRETASEPSKVRSRIVAKKSTSPVFRVLVSIQMLASTPCASSTGKSSSSPGHPPIVEPTPGIVCIHKLREETNSTLRHA